MFIKNSLLCWLLAVLKRVLKSIVSLTKVQLLNHSDYGNRHILSTLGHPVSLNSPSQQTVSVCYVRCDQETRVVLRVTGEPWCVPSFLLI